MWRVILFLGLMSVPGLMGIGFAKTHGPTIYNSYSLKQPLIEGWFSESAPFADLFQKLEKDFLRYGHSERMVKSIFYRSHQQLFHRYKQYTLDLDAVKEGLYDCVSGSLVIAALLDHFDFSYEIVETSYHVFLEVTVDGRHLLLEVTDPQRGVINMPEQRESYLNSYADSVLDADIWQVDAVNLPLPHSNIYHKISLRNLMGLQYFNQSIRYFNEGNPLAAYQFSVTALKYYDSERIRNFRDYLKQELMLAAN